MSSVLVIVAAVSFLVYQIVKYVEAALSEDGNRKYVWHDAFLLVLIVVIALFVGGVVALISQDQTATGSLGGTPWPFDNSSKSTKEWLRAVLLGYGAMPILKKGSLARMTRGSANLNTPLSVSNSGFRDHIRLWWRSM